MEKKTIQYKYTKAQWVKWYEQKKDLMENEYTEVTPLDFYKDLFDGVLGVRGNTKGKGNAMVDIIVNYRNRNKNNLESERSYYRKYVMTNDYVALKYMHNIEPSREKSRLCLCSPCTYYGKHKTNDMAHELVAIALDLDYVGYQQLKNIIKQIGNGARCMPPNYIVNSGRGLHFYYLLENPIPCYKYMLKSLTKFKGVLQDFIWNETSSIYPDKPDHGSITQAFRMVGSETKLGKEYLVRAYKVREKRWTIEELYAWVNARAPSFLKDCPLPELKEPLDVYRQKHPLTLKQAKAKYPDWDPDNPNKNKKWNMAEQKGHKGDELYRWWIRQIQDKAIVGGRYYSILALAAYGSKCDIPFEQVKKDALELYPYLESLTNDELNHFTKKDILDALRFYKNDNPIVTYKLTRQRISELTKIDIPKNKRNGRKLRTTHQEYRRTLKKLMVEFGECTNDGRPNKKQIVQEWKKKNPNGKKADCIRATGLSKPTVLKWWNVSETE